MIEYVVVYPYAVEGANVRLPLVLKNKPDYLEGMLNLPGGKINSGESPTDAAVRELKEEAGLEEIQEYDPMCYCPAEEIGIIQGTQCIIHCVRVPICSRQELNPNLTETEEISWYSFPDLLNLKNLMPNLRLIIPLMEKGVTGWKIADLDGNWWKKAYHTIMLLFKDMEDNPIRVTVNQETKGQNPLPQDYWLTVNYHHPRSRNEI